MFERDLENGMLSGDLMFLLLNVERGQKMKITENMRSGPKMSMRRRLSKAKMEHTHSNQRENSSKRMENLERRREIKTTRMVCVGLARRLCTLPL